MQMRKQMEESKQQNYNFKIIQHKPPIIKVRQKYVKHVYLQTRKDLISKNYTNQDPNDQKVRTRCPSARLKKGIIIKESR